MFKVFIHKKLSDGDEGSSNDIWRGGVIASHYFPTNENDYCMNENEKSYELIKKTITQRSVWCL